MRCHKVEPFCRRALLLVCALLLLTLSAPSATAQVAGTASIQGVVTDNTGAVIPSAQVESQNPETGVIVLSEEHLRRILKRYFLYYQNSRPHQSLDQNSPIPRTVESGKKGPVISIPEVGGLHHRYQRAA